jgi:hypothetical protein
LVEQSVGLMVGEMADVTVEKLVVMSGEHLVALLGDLLVGLKAVWLDQQMARQ